jgi:hypothetical protein
MKKIFLVLLFLCMAVFAADRIHADEIDDKQKVYETLLKLDDLYQADGFLINRSPVSPFDWIVAPSAVLKNYGEIIPVNETVIRITGRHLDKLERSGLCTEKYISVLRARMNAKKALSFGMLLADHPFADYLVSLIADKASFDYLVLDNNPDGSTDPILMENDKLTAEEIILWHKRRIAIKDRNNAMYQAIYTEVGLAVPARGSALYSVLLVKENQRWKVDDILIRSVSEAEVRRFHQKSMSLRKKLERQFREGSK